MKFVAIILIGLFAYWVYDTVRPSGPPQETCVRIHGGVNFCADYIDGLCDPPSRLAEFQQIEVEEARRACDHRTTLGTAPRSISTHDARTAPRAISTHDANLLLRIDAHISDWNRARTLWSRVYKSGDRARFLSVSYQYVSRMYVATVEMGRDGIVRIADQRLQDHLLKLQRAYAAQYDAVQRVGNSVQFREDRETLRRAVAQLHRAEKHKIQVASAIVSDYPQFRTELRRVANYH